MSVDDPVLVSVSGAIATVTLNRPKSFNAFNAPMRKQLLAAVRQLEADSSVRIVVLHGAGPGFCAGADLAEGVSRSVREQLENEYKPFLVEIADSAKIWIAAIHGSAAGIGGALAMTCDLAVMDEAATIYLAFAAIALVPDGGATWHLLRAMGHKRAMETIIEGRKITAPENVALGLVNVAAPAGTALDVARDWASRLALGAPLAQAAAKKLLRASHGETLAEAISHEARIQDVLIGTEDCRNAVAAFFAKQKPVFAGK